mmetsp:Transcript_53182/g.127175  ORF Transcript_53182/g.127175 Transcript_53182/m.127175 type:complete len:84 (-) Transcript_53182:467-718(-)
MPLATWVLSEARVFGATSVCLDPSSRRPAPARGSNLTLVRGMPFAERACVALAETVEPALGCGGRLCVCTLTGPLQASSEIAR